MKKTIFIITGLFILLQWACRLEELHLCDPDFDTFERLYNHEAEILSVGDMVATPDGDFVICGDIDDDVFLLKIDKAGNTVFFERDLIPVTKETCKSIAMTPDNGFVTCGEQESRAYLAKYDELGKHQNQDTQPQINSTCTCIAEANNGQYVISGSIFHQGSEQINTYVAPVVFNNTFPDITDGYLPVPARAGIEGAEAVITVSGEYVVVGFSYNSGIPGNGSVVHFYRLDNDFKLIEESEKFPLLETSTQQDDTAYDIVETPEGNYMIVGKLHNSANSDIFVIEVNKNGEILNQHNYERNAEDIALSIIEANQSGEYIIVGYSSSFGDGSDDIYVSKINQNGTLIWEKTFGQPDVDERASAVLRSEDCGYIIAGQSTENGLHRPYVVKINEKGNVQ